MTRRRDRRLGARRRRASTPSRPRCPAAEDRPGQREMAELVAGAIEHGRHLVVQAGTGTGKTLAYLVPAIASGKRRSSSPPRPRRCRTSWPPRTCRSCRRSSPSRASTSTGRCSRAAATTSACSGCARCTPTRPRPSSSSTTCRPTTKLEIKQLGEWAATSTTGDQAELDWSRRDAAWRAVSVGSDECPGADRCPLGEPCFAEQARRRAPGRPT